MKYLFTLLLFAFATLDAQASCGRIQIQISGRVSDSVGNPVVGAYVMTSWQELSAFVQQGEVRTTSNGHYSITLYFNPIVEYDPDRGHDCSAKLDSVITAVSARGFSSHIERHTISGSSTVIDVVLHPQTR